MSDHLHEVTPTTPIAPAPPARPSDWNGVERRLAWREERFHSLVLEQMSDAVVVCTSVGTIAYANPAMDTMYGSARGSWIGARLDTQCHAEGRDRARLVAELYAALATAGRWVGRWPARRADGTHFLLHLEVTSVELAGEVHWVSVQKDVTAEERIAIAEADRAELERQLLAVLSHDLRNPLNAILLGAEAALLHEGLPPGVVRSLQRIRTSSGRAGEVLRDLVDFVAVWRGDQIQIDRTPCDPFAVAWEVVDELQQASEGRTIDLSGVAMQAQLDTGRLAQALSLLVQDALVRAPQARITVALSAADADMATFTITDDGPRLCPEAIDAFFEPGPRRHGGPSTSSARPALGTYLARAIVVAHGGTIAVTSGPLSTTSVTMRLPRH